MDKSSDIQWYVLVAYRCESLAAAGATCKSALNMISVKLARALEPDSITFLALHPRPTPTKLSWSCGHLRAENELGHGSRF